MIARRTQCSGWLPKADPPTLKVSSTYIVYKNRERNIEGREKVGVLASLMWPPFTLLLIEGIYYMVKFSFGAISCINIF